MKNEKKDKKLLPTHSDNTHAYEKWRNKQSAEHWKNGRETHNSNTK